MDQPAISVIFTTYNQPAWLHKVLLGFSAQQFKSFEILVADDGSGEDTREVIEHAKTFLKVPLRHLWHPDDGYHKCDILNKAIVAAKAPYLVFTDGDCIPRSDFLAEHYANRSTRCFLSGGAVRLPMGISKAIGEEDILSGRCFDTRFLNRMVPGEQVHSKKLTRSAFLARLLNAFTTARPTWNGGNASCYKAHILAVNGMDERMKYGGQDRQLGERLCHLGLKGKQIRYKAICLHLDHKRGYVSEEGWRFNNALRKETKENRTIWSPYGIEKQERPDEAVWAASQKLLDGSF